MSIGLDSDCTGPGLWPNFLILDWIRPVERFIMLGSGPDLDWVNGKDGRPKPEEIIGNAMMAYFSLDILSCLKIRPYACLNKRVCSYPKIHPFNITSPSRFLFVLFYLWICASFFFYVNLCVANDLFRLWPAIIVLHALLSENKTYTSKL